MAQGPVTANLAQAWSTAVTVPCTLTTMPVSTEWRSTGTRAPAVRPPESSGLADGEAGPVLGDLVDVPDGVHVGYRSHLGPDAGGVSLPGSRAAGLRRRIPPRPCGAGNPPGRPVFPQLCVRGRWGWPCSPERWGASCISTPPGQAGREARGCRGGGLGSVPGWTSSGESGVPDLAVPGTGVMEVGGVSIAPVRRFVPGHAQPVQQLPRRVPVELHPGTPGRCGLHIECSFPWGCGADRARDSLLPARPPGKRPQRATASPACPCVRAFLLPRKSWAAARNRFIPRTSDGQYQLVGPHPAVSGADGSSAAQPLIPATGPPECRCGTSGSARPDRPR